MLKRIPFNDNLIPIGNASHYTGQQVWSDGRVAYGNVRICQRPVSAISSRAGFWVGEQSSINYQLAKKNLLLGHAIGSKRHGDIQCFPCYAEINSRQGQKDTGKCFFPYGSEVGCYEFEGGIVSISNDGRLLVYDDFFLDVLQAGQRKQLQSKDLYIADISVFDDNDDLLDVGNQYTKDNGTVYVYDNSTLIATYHEGQVSCGQYSGEGKITIENSFAYFEKAVAKHIDLQLLVNENNVIRFVDYFNNNNVRTIDSILQTHDARRMFQLAKFTQNGIDAFITAETPDRNQQGDILHSGTFNVVYELIIASGQGNVVVNNGVHVYDSNNNEIFQQSANSLFAVNNGALSFLGYGRIYYEDNGIDYDYELRLYIDGIQGTGYLTYSGNNKYIRNIQDTLIAREDSDNLYYHYDSYYVWYGPGSIVISQETPVEYVGDWSIILTGSGRITDPTGNIDIVDGNLHIAKNGGDISIDDAGNSVYSGAGTITVSNLQPIGGGIYTGDYVVTCDGHGKIESTDLQDNCKFYEGNNYVAEYSSGYVTFASGYTTLGRQTTSDLTATKWFCTWEIDAEFLGQGTIWEHDNDIFCEESNIVVAYEDKEEVVVESNGSVIYQDAGHIETNATIIKSIKSYEIINDVQLQQYPNSWAIGDNAALLLPSMALQLGQQTIQNDPLGILSPSDWTTWPGGVHACNGYVISQDGQKIWHNSSQTYAGIENCFSLAWLSKKWK